MRVLTVGNMYPPHHLGGYEQDWAAGVHALRGAGHDVRVLVSDHREPGVAEPDEAGVFRDLRWYWSDHAFPKRSLRERFAIERQNARVLAAQLADFRPDVVSWWPMGGMSLSLVARVHRTRIPALGVVYDDWMVYGPRVDAWQATWRRTPRLADAARWLFASDSVRRAALEAVPELEDTDLLAPGLDETFLDPAPPREWGWRLLAPGRLDPRKGLRTAVEALALLPRARLAIVGGGDEGHAAELRSLAAELGVAERVDFQPPRPRAELVAAYRDADAVLFPVLWAEPFGLVPLEAMGIGRPVVATGRGGSGEYLRDGENCLLHEPGDARSLAQAVERLAADAALRERLRAGGFQTAPRFARGRWNERVVAEHEACGGS
ncbi:MAG: glycosyltransferase family 4 protein [Thermoleophilaceae bacterium]